MDALCAQNGLSTFRGCGSSITGARRVLPLRDRGVDPVDEIDAVEELLSDFGMARPRSLEAPQRCTIDSAASTCLTAEHLGVCVRARSKPNGSKSSMAANSIVLEGVACGEHLVDSVEDGLWDLAMATPEISLEARRSLVIKSGSSGGACILPKTAQQGKWPIAAFVMSGADANEWAASANDQRRGCLLKSSVEGRFSGCWTMRLSQK